MIFPGHLYRGSTHMLDEEIASLLEDAGYRFIPESVRYQAILGAGAEETDHSSEFIADELGIDVDDLRRWEDGQLEAQGLMRSDPEAPAPTE
jgi:hypothetical protein